MTKHTCDPRHICMHTEREVIVAVAESGYWVATTDHGLVNTSHTRQGRDVKFVPRKGGLSKQ